MSLDFNVTRIPNHEKVTTEIRDGRECWHWLTESLVFHCLGNDMQEITEKNLDEFMIRMRIRERVFGCSPLTREQVASHIGLSTNVSNKTRSQFLKKIGEILALEAMREVQNERNASARPAEPVKG